MADVGEIKYIASIDTSAYKKGAKDIDDANKNIEKSTDNAEKSTSKFGKSGAAAFGLISGAAFALANKAIAAVSNSFDAAIKRVDTLNNAPKVLQNLGFSAEDSAKAIKQIDKGVRGLPTSLDAIASSLVSIASSSGLSIDKATDLTVAFNNMALAGGKGPQEAQRALVQFTQALGKGTIPAQEFNTLMEVMPAQMTQVAKTLLGGEANAYKLRDAMSDGSVTIDQFNDTVIKLNKEGGSNFASFAKQAESSTDGIATGWQLVQTAITRGLGNIIKEIGSENITNAFGVIQTSIDNIFNVLKKAITVGKEVSGFISSLATAGKDLVVWAGIWNGVSAAIESVNKHLRPLIDNFVTYLWPIVKQLGEFIGGVFLEAWNNVTEAFKQLMIALQPLMPALKMVGGVIAVAIIAPLVLLIATIAVAVVALTGIVTAVVWVFGQVAKFVGAIVGKFNEVRRSVSNIDWSQVGRDIIRGIGNGIAGMGAWLAQKAVEAVSGAKTAIKKFFGIKSPSTVMRDEVGKMIGAGLAIGIDKSAKDVQTSMVNLTGGIPTDLTGSYSIPSSARQTTPYISSASMGNIDGVSTSTTNTYQISIPISGAIVTSPQDQRKFAEVIGKKINEVMQQKGYKPALEGM